MRGVSRHVERGERGQLASRGPDFGRGHRGQERRRVDLAHLERAVNAYMTLQKTMAEGAGAAGLAAMLDSPARFRGKIVGLVLTGVNIDPRILASIMVRE